MRDPRLEKFYDMLEHFDVVMLTTRSAHGELRSRPMALVDCDRRGDIWLVSDRSAAKLDEIHDDPRVNLSAQSRERYLSLSGVAERVDDPQAMRLHATARIERWLAEFNIVARDVVLLRIVPQTGEYWDEAELRRGNFVYEAARDLLTDSTTFFRDDEEAHAKVDLERQRRS